MALATSLPDASSIPSKPGLEFTYEVYSTQVGLFLDTGGRDRFRVVDPNSGAESER